MAEVRYMAYHTGGVPKSVKAATPAEIAEQEGFSIADNEVSIFVGGEKATPNTKLKEGQVVSFQKSKQESGKSYRILR